MYQARTQVNVLSPVICNVVGVDGIHYRGRQHGSNRNRQGCDRPIGVLGTGMMQDGICVNLGEPLVSPDPWGYCAPSLKGQDVQDESMAVGLPDSTLRLGEPTTWGSGQRYCDKSSACHPNTLRLGSWRR